MSISENQVREYVTISNLNTIKQTSANLAFVLDTLDPLILLLENSEGLTSVFDELFNHERLSYNDVRSQTIVNGFMSSMVMSKPFVHSLYIYFENPNGYVYVANDGRMPIAKFLDQDWYRQYKAHSRTDQNWTVVRTIPFSSAEPVARKVISIFQPLGSGTGVAVLNLKPEALSSIWSNLSMLENQDMFMVSDDGTILLSLRENTVISKNELHEICQKPVASLGPFIYKSTIVNKIRNERYGWTLISLTPEASLYRLPVFLSTLTVILLILSFLVAVLLTSWLVRSNYRQVQRIATLLESTGQNADLPVVDDPSRDIFSRITYDIVRSFVEQKYLNLQLSEKNYRLRVLELETRRNQMNPHFMLNTLKTIYWKSYALTTGPNDVSNMIENLSALLEYSLRGSSEEVTLQEEISASKDYLAIQQVRYKGRFELFVDCPARLGRCSIPKLVLQPLLENSIYHGIKEAEGFCRMTLRVRKARSRLIIALSDQGIGMDALKLADIRKSMDEDDGLGSHIGLANTNRRIKLRYGDVWGLSIRSQKGKGTTVRVFLPFNIRSLPSLPG